MNVTVFHLYDGEYFKHFKHLDHYTIIVEGLVPQCDRAAFVSRLRAEFRKTPHGLRLDVIATDILSGIGYATVDQSVVEDVDFTDIAVSY